MIVKKITQKPNYYLVLFEDGTSYKIHEQVIINYHILKRGMEISDDKMPELLLENEYYMALSKGMNYLSVVHSKKEVYLYLLKHFSKDASRRACDKLVEMNLINDNEYMALLLDYSIRNLKGFDYFINELKEQEIASDKIEMFKEDYTVSIETQVCTKAFLKQIKNTKKVSLKKAIEKMKIHLLSRGFRMSVVNQVVSENKDLFNDYIDTTEALEKAYLLLVKKYSRKYQGNTLKEKITQKLLADGFTYQEIKAILERGGTND